MGAVPDLVAASFEPAGKRDLDVALDGSAEEGGGRLAGAAEDDVRAGEVRELLVGQHGDPPLPDDGELLRRDLLPGVAEHVGVLEPDVGQQDDSAAENVGRVEPAAEARLDDGDVDFTGGELGERGRAQRLELRRLLCLGLRPHALDRSLEVHLLRRRP